MARPHGRAKVDPTNPRAFGICDRCGLLYNHGDLRWQYDYRGLKLANTRLLVCDICLDDPQPQLKPRIIGPDPLPILNARPETTVTVATTVTTTYQVLATDQLINCTGSNSFTVTLSTAAVTANTTTWPVARGTAGRTVTVQANGTGTITVAALGGQLIQNELTYTLNPGEEIAMWADGTNWETIPCLPFDASLITSEVLLEDGSFLLLEDGSFVLLEGSNP